jgi:integrase/recombinase XerD
VPAHHNAEAYLDAYLHAATMAEERKLPLFRSAAGKTGTLTDQPLVRRNAIDMVKRRAKAAGLPKRICCHTFRATGITAYLENGGTIEHAQQIACHESPKTTKLYDRTSDQITLDEVERIIMQLNLCRSFQNQRHRVIVKITNFSNCTPIHFIGIENIARRKSI